MAKPKPARVGITIEYYYRTERFTTWVSLEEQKQRVEEIMRDGYIIAAWEDYEPIDTYEYAKYFVYHVDYRGDPFSHCDNEAQLFYQEGRKFAKNMNLNHDSFLADVNDILSDMIVT